MANIKLKTGDRKTSFTREEVRSVVRATSPKYVSGVKASKKST